MTSMHCLNFEDCVQTHFGGQVMCTLYSSLALTAVSSIALRQGPQRFWVHHHDCCYWCFCLMKSSQNEQWQPMGWQKHSKFTRWVLFIGSCVTNMQLIEWVINRATYKQYGSESDLTIALVHQECGCRWYCNKYNVNIPAWNTAQLAHHILNHVVFQANASVQVDAADRFGILVTNGEFTAFVDPKFGTQV